MVGKHKQNMKRTPLAICFSLMVTAFALPLPLAFAQDAAESADALIDVAKIRSTLQENAKQHPSAAVDKGSAAALGSAAQLETEDQRLAEQEKALLAQIESGAPAPQKEQAPSTRASLDLDKALDELTAPDSEAQKPADEAGSIQVVVKSPKKRFMSDPNLQGTRMTDGQSFNSAALNQPEEHTAENQLEKSALTRNLESQLDEKSKSLNALTSTNNALQSQLQSAQRKVSELNRELSETRNRLIIAETEVERLTSVVAVHGGGVIRNKPQSISENSARRTYKPVSADSGVSPAQEAKMSGDMMVATVIADKAHLRTGPGKDNSPLMSVSKGTRLAVETRQADWYRVIAPTGVRAWVASEVVAFGPSGSDRPTRTVQVKGYDASREDEAVRLLSEGR